MGEGHRIAWHLRVLDGFIPGSSLLDSDSDLDLVFKLYFITFFSNHNLK